MMHTTSTTDVAIVGAGPIGLTLSNLLSRHEVSHIVVEAHPGLSLHPKARGVSARSMEIFRSLGLEPDIRTAGLPADHVRFYRGVDLVDPDFTRTGPATSGNAAGNTPSPGLICSQDALEPVLLAHARNAGADIRFGVRVVGMHPDQDGVSLQVTNRAGSALSPIHARFIIGCDGGDSTIRELSGIGMTGHVGLGHYLSVRFRAPLGAVVADRASASYFLTGKGRGGFLAIDNDTRWIYQYPVDPSSTDVEELRANAASLIGLIRAAAGVPGLDAVIEDTMLWRMDARQADTYRRDRILLAGDAAHLTPPTGGHGMNVGIGDVDTLAWQLAAVVRGEADESLLERYTRERRPVGMRVIEISTQNSRKNYAMDDELLLNTNYGVGENALPDEPYAPSAAPGRRLPHVTLSGPTGVTSTLDLIGGRFTVLTTGEDPDWSGATETLAADHPRLQHASVLTADRAETDRGSWAAATRLAGGEALLIRPDGHVASRLPRVDRTTALRAALRRVHRVED